MQNETGEKVHLSLGGTDVVLEIAETDQKRSLGLMRRKTLGENHGMLFISPEAKILRFYMRDTWIPLSIAFIKQDGTIINIEEMRPNTETPSHISKGFCRFAIEMNKDWFQRNSLKPGDKITWTPEILAIQAS
ncbi:MAG: DUF192 domain-containing protein [Planctomycetes bacterium]|nr:DUF192 domain-containing protein [Planctomycetota bacterium]